MSASRASSRVRAWRPAVTEHPCNLEVARSGARTPAGPYPNAALKWTEERPGS